MARLKRRSRSGLEALEPRLVLSASLPSHPPAAIDTGGLRRGMAPGAAIVERDGRCLDACNAAGAEQFDRARDLWEAVAGANHDRARWAESGRLTYSIIPDGADVGGTPNTLDAALKARGIPSAAWRAEVHRAAATWAEATGIELVFVPDDGSPLGTFGPLSGNPHFGDIRIAGMSLPAPYAAGTFEPPPKNWGTESGDIVLNVDLPWDWGNNGIDFRTVLIHEFGHALGAGHVETEGAALNEHYEGLRRSLTPEDLAAVPARDGIDWSMFMPGDNGGQAPRFWWSELEGAGDEASVRIMVDQPGLFFIGAFEKDGSGDASALIGAGSDALDGPGALVPASGRIELSIDGPIGPRPLTVNGLNFLFLGVGEYEVRARALEGSPPPLATVVQAVNFVPESLRLNGVGHLGAARMQLIGSGVVSTEETFQGPTGSIDVTASPDSTVVPKVASAPRAEPPLLSPSAILVGRPEDRALSPATGPAIALFNTPSAALAAGTAGAARGQGDSSSVGLDRSSGRSRTFSGDRADADLVEAAVLLTAGRRAALEPAFPSGTSRPEGPELERESMPLDRLARSLASLFGRGRQVRVDRVGTSAVRAETPPLDSPSDDLLSGSIAEAGGQDRDWMAGSVGVGLLSVMLCRVGLRRIDRRRAGPLEGTPRADPRRTSRPVGRFSPGLEPDR